MDVVVEGEFLLEEFSPQSLVYVPELNCVLTSNGCGEVASINVVTGQIRKYQGKVWSSYLASSVDVRNNFHKDSEVTLCSVFVCSVHVCTSEQIMLWF